MEMQGKIIAVGFQKTGLTSLYTALEILGKKVTTGRQSYKTFIKPKAIVEMLEKKDHGRLFSYLTQYDAVTDNPWNILFEELDQNFPGSKFIFTYRNEAAWLSSAKRYFRHRPDTAIRRWVYKVASCKDITDEIYLERYRAHNTAVLRYFEGRSDFLKLDVFSGEGWDKLCPFLDRPILNLPFPHSNKNLIEKQY